MQDRGTINTAKPCNKTSLKDRNSLATELTDAEPSLRMDEDFKGLLVKVISDMKKESVNRKMNSIHELREKST